jgi:hypothetical protein
MFFIIIIFRIFKFGLLILRMSELKIRELKVWFISKLS